MLFIVAIVDSTYVDKVVKKYQSISYLVAIDCTHNMVSYSVLRDLDNIVQENSTADILIEDELWASFGMVTVNQEHNCTDQIAELSASHCCGVKYVDNT